MSPTSRAAAAGPRSVPEVGCPTAPGSLRRQQAIRTHPALDGVGLSVAAARCMPSSGENGAGKSTLMKILSGALMPDAGTMSLEGAPYQPRDPMDARDGASAMVYQELSLAPHLTVAENILLGVEPSRGGSSARRHARGRARGAGAAGSWEIPVGSRAGSLPVAVPAAGRGRPRPRPVRHARPHPRRADEQPGGRRCAAAVRGHPAAPGARAERALHLARCSKRCRRSRTASPCCATAARSAAATPARWRAGRSCA